MQASIPQLSIKELRNFGFVTGCILVFLFALLLPWFFDKEYQIWPFYIATPLWLLAVLIPAWLRGIYYVWMKIGMALGWVNSRIILSLAFYLLIFPIGLIFLLIGKDPMMRKLDSKVKSYKILKEIRNKKHIERPF